MEHLKVIAVTVVLVIISGSIIANCFGQLTLLLQAKAKNNNLTVQIDQLQKRKTLLTQKVKYASQSAAIIGEIHDKLLKGGDDDYLLQLPSAHDFSLLYPQEQVVESVPIYQQWINLFVVPR